MAFFVACFLGTFYVFEVLLTLIISEINIFGVDLMWQAFARKKAVILYSSLFEKIGHKNISGENGLLHLPALVVVSLIQDG